MSQNFYTFNSFFATRAARAWPPVAPHEARFRLIIAHLARGLGTRYNLHVNPTLALQINGSDVQDGAAALGCT